MGKFISNFETTAELEAFSATTDFGRPHVSLTKDDSKIHFFEDPYKGHQYVEIGGLKWATMNVGANSITDYGLYFQWGDTQGYTASQVGSGEGQKYFGWSDYKYSDNGTTAMTKYNSTDGKTVLDLDDDAAQGAWGGSWKMPTFEEFETLSAETTNVWVYNYNGSGVNGRLFKSKSDETKTLFFPAGGNCRDGKMTYNGSLGDYWFSSLLSNNNNWARCFMFRYENSYVSYGDRFGGLAVRAVVG